MFDVSMYWSQAVIEQRHKGKEVVKRLGWSLTTLKLSFSVRPTSIVVYMTDVYITSEHKGCS